MAAIEDGGRMSARPQVWTMGVGLPRLTARLAERAEAAGWDGMLVVDSQNLAGDPYVGLAVAAGATERLLLGTGVTNPWTRHPAVTACAIASGPGRVAWAIETARHAALAGRVPDAPLSLGAYVNVVVHPDPAVALELARGSLASFARFSVMHGRSTGPVADDERAVLESIHHAYDMTAHTRAGTPQAAALTADFAKRFAVLGPADHCLRRLRELLDLGLDHLMIIGGSIGADRKEVGLAASRFVEEVLPELR